jgi:predicted aconitase with swiveling domain
MNKVFKCHKISEGKTQGEVIVSKDDIMFYLIDPDTGKFIEHAHDLEGKIIANKILVFPSGKGSSVVQADGLFQLMKKGNQPKAMIVEHSDTVLVTSAILFEIPMVDNVDKEFYETVKDGDTVVVDADREEVIIL